MKKMLLKFLPLAVALIGFQTASQAQATFTADLEFLPQDEVSAYTLEVGENVHVGVNIVNHGPDDIDTTEFVIFGMTTIPDHMSLVVQGMEGERFPILSGDTVFSRGVVFGYSEEFTYERDTTFEFCFFSKVNWDADEFVFDPNEKNDTTCFTITYKGVGVSSAKDIKLASKISIYPNPATDIVNIPVAAMHRGQDITLTVAAIDGRIVHTQSVKQNDRPIELSLNKWTKGLYIVTLQSAAGKETGRFVVQ